LHELVLRLPTTSQCAFCEMYPTTVYGFAAHIEVQHNSTLTESILSVPVEKKFALTLSILITPRSARVVNFLSSNWMKSELSRN
ncbi:hypothetical protein PENTCL1PPCAC_13389, partial [Pristionchus entomophagus]